MSGPEVIAAAQLALDAGLETRSEILAWVGKEYPEASVATRHAVVTRAFALLAAQKREGSGTESTRSTHEDLHGPVEDQPPTLPLGEGFPNLPAELDGVTWGASWKESPLRLREAFEAAVRQARSQEPEPGTAEALEWARGVWAWPFSPQAFFIGPWRRAQRAKGNVAVQRPAEHKPKAQEPPNKSQPVTPQQGAVRLEGPAGRYTAWPADKRGEFWELELRVRCSRDTALHLQGQAFSILFPDAARRVQS